MSDDLRPQYPWVSVFKTPPTIDPEDIIGYEHLLKDMEEYHSHLTELHGYSTKEIRELRMRIAVAKQAAAWDNGFNGG